MSDLAETFQNDISQIFNERGLLRTELIAKEKLLTDALLQKNALNQSIKQARHERDDLFANNQKLKQEKLAAEAEKSASTIHVTILKEEKNLLEQRLLQSTQQHEEARRHIDELSRENAFLKAHRQQQVSTPIQHTHDHRDELNQSNQRYTDLKSLHDALVERHRQELQLLRNESSAKDEQMQSLHQLLAQYEQKLLMHESTRKELEQRVQDISQSCRSHIPDRLLLSNEELRTIEADPNSSSILAIYRSSKSLFDILVDYALLQKQNESLTSLKEKIDSQRRYNENLLHQTQADLQQLRVQNERLQYLADSRQTEYEQAIRDKQTLFKEKLELDKQLQQKLREFDDCLDDRNNMRAQIFNLLEHGSIKGHLRSMPPMVDNEILARQGVVTFNSVEELYEQYMKTLVDIRETDRFILELEDTHAKELTEISQREYQLKESFEQIRSALEQTKTDLHIQTLAKQVLDREHHLNGPKVPTGTANVQTDIRAHDLTRMDNELQEWQRLSSEKDLQLDRIKDDTKLAQQKLDHAQKQNQQDKQKIADLQRLIDESLQRANTLLADVQASEFNCEQLKEQNLQVQHQYDQLSSSVSLLKADIEKLQTEKEQMSQLQEQVLDRIKQDIEAKSHSQEENLLNAKLQQSVEELNTIMKDCVKQTELTNGTPAHIANLTKLEILYRQLQQRHQYDREQHFAITESLKIKVKDAQVDSQKLERQCEELRSNFHDEQTKLASKIVELESKLRNADTTTVLTRLLPSATLENRLKEEEERTQQLRTWTNKLTEKIENIQKQMATDKKEYEDKVEEVRQELKESRNECSTLEKRLEAADEEQRKHLSEFKEKEETLEMEVFKLKTELDSGHVTHTLLKETIALKENDLRVLHERIIDYDTKMHNLEKEYSALQEKCARQTREHNLPISEPPSPIRPDLAMDESSLDASVETKTPSKRRRIVSSSDRTPIKLRSVRSQSVDCQPTSQDGDELADDNDDAISTCSEPPSAKKRKRRANEAARLPAVNEEGDADDGNNGSAANTPTYNLRSRTKRLVKHDV